MKNIMFLISIAFIVTSCDTIDECSEKVKAMGIGQDICNSASSRISVSNAYTEWANVMILSSEKKVTKDCEHSKYIQKDNEFKTAINNLKEQLNRCRKSVESDTPYCDVPINKPKTEYNREEWKE